MAYKRSRAAFEFESDLQAQQSPFAFYGSPLPPLDEHARDDGSYVPVWKQTVTDERGRKRLHGAFTGGFSAGYFNTVGSKEGWTPSTFVSSRANRHQAQPKVAGQRPEDFMDEEDLADAAESRQLQTTQAFASLGDAVNERDEQDPFFGLVAAGEDTMGVKLLQRMGWRRGQGIGPKQRRKARMHEGDGDLAEENVPSTHLFAPDDSRVIALARKDDRKGLGFQSEARLPTGADEDLVSARPDNQLDALKPRKQKVKAQLKRTGFGVGVLNDNGSDDEDPYQIGPNLSYNRVLGGDKKLKKSKPLKSNNASVNPLVTTRPIFRSKKTAKRDIGGFRPCHDGRLPLDGFVLSCQSSAPIAQPSFPPLKVPAGWDSSQKPRADAEPSPSQYQSVGEAAKASSLDAKARASLLGESALPGKSVFNYLSKETRDRIASASGKTNLPQGLGEAPPEAYRRSVAAAEKDLRRLVPFLGKDIALAALHKGSNGWMPYAEDSSKRSRYKAFLEMRAERSDDLPGRAPGVAVADWVKELEEFAHAAEVFKPISGIMASRFTSAGSGAPSDGSRAGKGNLSHTAGPNSEDPAEQAAKVGMYGPMTRSNFIFVPTRLLCKRFNVAFPDSTQYNTETAPTNESPSNAVANRLEIMGRSQIDDMLKEAFKMNPVLGQSFPVHVDNETASAQTQDAIVDVETNAALEAERPGADVFRAIFGSDDED